MRLDGTNAEQAARSSQRTLGERIVLEPTMLDAARRAVAIAERCKRRR